MPCTSFGNVIGCTPAARLEECGGTLARLVPGRLPAAGLTAGVGAGLGAGCLQLGQQRPALSAEVIPCATGVRLQMPVAGGRGGGSPWKRRCGWGLLLLGWLDLGVGGG